jgi:hypothetical protein
MAMLILMQSVAFYLLFSPFLYKLGWGFFFSFCKVEYPAGTMMMGWIL